MKKKRWDVFPYRESILKIIRVMKLVSFLLFAGFLQVTANIYSQNANIKLSMHDVALFDVIKEIQKQTEFTFFYSPDDVKDVIVSKVELEKASLESALDLCLKGTNLNYEIVHKAVILKKEKKLMKGPPTEPALQQPQKRDISGTVKDSKGIPLPGVTVVVKGTTLGIITDADGKYVLTLPADAKTLIFKFIGLKAQEIEIDGKRIFNVVLEEEIIDVEEVVIVGYGRQKKETVVGAIATIKATELLQSPQANISNALVGRLPGLFAVQNSGEPGKDQSTLRIRGIGTFAGDQNPLIMVDGIETPNYNNIDPNEIESLTILKDASATAVYGVRGANGVLLITTKRGQTGKPKISLTTSAAITILPFLRPQMNSYEYTSNYNKGQAYDSFVNGNYNPKYTDTDIALYQSHEDPIFHPDVDWVDYMLKDYSSQTQSNLNISGGTEKVKYFVSLGYYTETGMFNTDIIDAGYDPQIRYKRYNMRANFDFQITKRLSAAMDIATQIDDRRYLGNWSTALFFNMLSSQTPISSPGVIDNKVITLNTVMGTGTFAPPLALLKGFRRDFGNNLSGSVRFNYNLDQITNGLSARALISYKNFNSQNQYYNFMAEGLYKAEALKATDGSTIIQQSGEFAAWQFSESADKNRRTDLEVGLEYTRKFGDHNVGGLLMYNQQKIFNPGLAFLVPRGHQGIVGRVTYSYKNRYLTEFNLGYNGTENFAPGKRFGFFPAYSAGWVASQEPFFPANNYVTFIKIRGSYGEVGNDEIGGTRFLYRPTSYTYTNNGYYFGQYGSNYQGYRVSNEGSLGNPDLTWERAKKMNIGAEINLFNNKISITADYFIEKRDNILANKGTIPQIIGMTLPAYNLGKMKNGGFDGDISFNNKLGSFVYYIKANYTYAHNVIEFQDEVLQPYPYQYRTGQRYGQRFGLVAEGLFNTWEEVNVANRPVYSWSSNKIQPGDIRYKDVNGDGRIDVNDQVPIGYSNFPEKIFGISLGGSFKGFDISILFQGAANVSMYPSRNSIQGFVTGGGANKDLDLYSWTYERYTQGLLIKYPRLNGSGGSASDHLYQGSTFWYEDASYLRLKNMEIGYTLSKGLIKRIGLGSVRIFVNGNNLITWCKLFPGEDPEYPNVSANEEPYPVESIYNLGLRINF